MSTTVKARAIGLAVFVASAIAVSGCAAGSGGGAIASALLLMLTLAGCYGAHTTPRVGEPRRVDAGPSDAGRDAGGSIDAGPLDAGADEDGDGWVAGVDCDDHDPTIHPGAEERCTMSCDEPVRDEDCDRRIDEDCAFALNCFYDADGDGYGSGFGPGPDCDDTDPTIHPTAPEQCDAVDQDCDGVIDEMVDSPFGCMNGFWDAPDDDDDRSV